VQNEGSLTVWVTTHGAAAPSSKVLMDVTRVIRSCSKSSNNLAPQRLCTGRRNGEAAQPAEPAHFAC
jgi:hypothetical protein